MSLQENINTNTSTPIEGWGGEQLNNEEMDQEVRIDREYDELHAAFFAGFYDEIRYRQDDSSVDWLTLDVEVPIPKPQDQQPLEEGCQCACCLGTCACGRGHACDEEDDNRYNDYDTYDGGLEWNESGYYD